VKKILQPATQTVSHQPAKQPRTMAANGRRSIWTSLLKSRRCAGQNTVDQLASQPKDNGAISLQLNIPFAEGNYQDIAKLHIASEGAAAHDELINPAWTATIELQPPGMGAFNARIVWNGSASMPACGATWKKPLLDQQRQRNIAGKAGTGGTGGRDTDDFGQAAAPDK